MCAVVLQESEVRIPEWVVDLASFRRWADADDFPETGRICYLKGEVWVDMSKEQIFWHVAMKGTIASQLGTLLEAERLGHYFTSGFFLSNPQADLAAKPDGTFLSARGIALTRSKVPRI